jgi:hypothetical protein
MNHLRQPIPNYNIKMKYEYNFGEISDHESYQYYWSGTVCPRQSTRSEHLALTADGITRRMRQLLGIIKVGRLVNLSIHLANF